MIVHTLVLALVVTAFGSQNQDLGRQATITALTDPIKNKKYDLTAISSTSKATSATHQLIQIIIPKPDHACSQLQSINSTIEGSYPAYLLVQGSTGHCTYANKVKWAKRTMAKGIIIIHSQNNINNLRAKEGQKYHIYLMDSKQGNQLISKLQNSDTRHFTAVLNIGSRKQIQKQPMQIWISSLNHQSYELLRWFQVALNSIPSLSQRLEWRPRFAYVTNTKGKKSGFVTSCACDGMFCSPQFHGVTSHIIIREDIRQMLIFNHYRDKFLEYMMRFKDRCLDKFIKEKAIEDCSASVSISMGIDSTNITRRIDNFLEACTKTEALTQSEIIKLYQQMTLDRVKYMHVRKYPVTILDHKQIQAKNSEEYQKVFCKKLGMEQQEGCQQIIANKSVFSVVVTGIFWVIFILGLMIAGAMAVFYFRRKMKKEVDKELKMQVSTAVEHYYQLSQNSQTK